MTADQELLIINMHQVCYVEKQVVQLHEQLLQPIEAESTLYHHFLCMEGQIIHACCSAVLAGNLALDLRPSICKWFRVDALEDSRHLLQHNL